MPIIARRKGEDILVDNVDFKSLARRICRLISDPSFSPPKDLNASMEFLARAMRYPDLHALLAQARTSQPVSTLESSLSFGSEIPKDAPAWLDRAWRDVATALFSQALANRRKDRVEFIALIAPAGHGKTALANLMAKRLGGAVLALERDRLGAGWAELHKHPRPLMVFDSPAKPLKPHPDFMTRLRYYDLLPLILSNTESAVVMTFEDIQDVRDFLVGVLNPQGESHFESAQVLDLLFMNLTLVESARPKAQPGRPPAPQAIQVPH